MSNMKNTTAKEWLRIFDVTNRIAIRTQVLSKSDSYDVSCSLTLRIDAREDGFIPILFLRMRSKKKSALPHEVTMQLLDGVDTRIIASSESEPIHSILHKDYVSTFQFQVNEIDLLRAFRKELEIQIVYGDNTCPLTLFNDDSFLFLELKVLT